MRTRIYEVTNGEMNWAKIMIMAPTTEWDYVSAVAAERPLLSRIGWTPDNLIVLDLQTGEGARFRPGGNARADLEKHRIWVCPLFEPFLEWLYHQPNPWVGPSVVDLPAAEFAFRGYRRKGPPPPSIEDQIVELQAARARIEAKLDSLYDAAKQLQEQP